MMKSQTFIEAALKDIGVFDRSTDASFPEVLVFRICDTRAQNQSYVVFGFLFSHILHWIYFKILFTESKYLVLTEAILFD